MCCSTSVGTSARLGAGLAAAAGAPVALRRGRGAMQTVCEHQEQTRAPDSEQQSEARGGGDVAVEAAQRGGKRLLAQSNH